VTTGVSDRLIAYLSDEGGLGLQARGDASSTYGPLEVQ
jgi:hypothetical protein